ncbi:MAG TPA: immunoglobulin domain-containing protein, partial [Methylomirabilota bacterium]|nr:immunoglobulin domain-containing protein [Methylomirabilota bacterium]
MSRSATAPRTAPAITSAANSKLLGLGLLDDVSALLGSLPLWKTVGEGEPLTLSIGVDVLQLVSLQWYFNGQPISGANRGTLIIPSIQSAHVGQYQLRATLLGITLLSIPTDVQINDTDGTVNRSSAAFDKLSDVTAAAPAAKSKASRAKAGGGTAHGYSGTQIFNTLGSTKDPGEPSHCGIPGGASEWYAWQPPTNGTAVIATDGSTFDTVLAVYI